MAWLFGLMLLALVCALYFVTRRWAGPMLVVFLLIPTLVGASLGLSMRPQVLSYSWSWSPSARGCGPGTTAGCAGG